MDAYFRADSQFEARTRAVDIADCVKLQTKVQRLETKATHYLLLQTNSSLHASNPFAFALSAW